MGPCRLQRESAEMICQIETIFTPQLKLPLRCSVVRMSKLATSDIKDENHESAKHLGRSWLIFVLQTWFWFCTETDITIYKWPSETANVWLDLDFPNSGNGVEPAIQYYSRLTVVRLSHFVHSPAYGCPLSLANTDKTDFMHFTSKTNVWL